MTILTTPAKKSALSYMVVYQGDTMEEGISHILAVESNEVPCRLLTVREVAEFLHVHPNTVRQWSEKGLIRSCRVGSRGDRRFSVADVNGIVSSSGRSPSGIVLIVDDDPAVRELLADVVMREGYAAVSVGSAEEALEELQRQQYDLVFLDLALPGLSGLEVLRSIKDGGNKAVVAVITGYHDEPTALEAMSLGPAFFIRKPLKLADIVHVLDTTIGSRRYPAEVVHGPLHLRRAETFREGQNNNDKTCPGSA